MIAAVADAGDGITDDHAELYIYITLLLISKQYTDPLPS